MSDSEPDRIEYEPPPVGGGITRRQGRWIILLLLINTILLGTNAVVPQMWAGIQKQWTDWAQQRAETKRQQALAATRKQQTQQLLAAQQQWLTYETAPTTLIYEEDPQAASKLLLTGRGFHQVGVSNLPGSASSLWQPAVMAPAPESAKLFLSSFANLWGMAFLHERRSPNGKARLVCVTIDSTQHAQQDNNRNVDYRVLNLVRVVADVFEPATADSGIAEVGNLRRWKRQTLGLDVPKESRTLLKFPGNTTADTPTVQLGVSLRIFAGAPDANDPSHFTIPYQLGSVNGTIDGWLRNDAVELRPRDGQIGPQSSWIVPSSKP